MSYMYALFVNMYDNLYYMLTQEIKAICAWCCTGLRCERAVRGRFCLFAEENLTGRVGATYANRINP
jgi:hypothetical protein